MCKIYGYVRVSTIQQKVERQINNIIGFNGDAIIISEKQSGKDIDNRAEFKKLLNKVKPGDTIIFDEVSRMSRNADEGFSLYADIHRCEEENIHLLNERMQKLAKKFNVEPRKLLSHVLEYKLTWDIMYPIGWTYLKVHSLKSDR